MPKQRKYYTLAVFDGYWAPQFGDYDRAVVDQERQDWRDNGTLAKHLKVIATGDSDASIMAAIDKLNQRKVN